MLDDAVNAKLTNERMLTAILTALALLAALLSAVGVYGITAYAVAQRRREIGIRAALGARPLQIVQFVSRHATIAVMVGGIIGVGAATVASRLIESALFGVERLQPTIYVIGVLAFVPIAALAAALPARAATTVDPLEALRAE
jgi:ABC-type antimicrobial peptide transport system permease subunit